MLDPTNDVLREELAEEGFTPDAAHAEFLRRHRDGELDAQRSRRIVHIGFGVLIIAGVAGILGARRR